MIKKKKSIGRIMSLPQRLNLFEKWQAIPREEKKLLEELGVISLVKQRAQTREEAQNILFNMQRAIQNLHYFIKMPTHRADGPCTKCNAAIGSPHKYDCGNEVCPFCFDQLIGCKCAYKLLNIDLNQSPEKIDRTLKRKLSKWKKILKNKGQIVRGNEWYLR